jgi:ubiquinone/menaquinone biosynthesis C-methylase UbiE
VKVSNWQPSKYIKDKNGRLVASRDKREVFPASRFIAGLTATWYDENLKRFAHGKLLDLGCGKAPLYGTYARYVNDVVLADWKKSPYTDVHVDVRCDIAKRLPFQDNSFDTIILSDVLEHIPEPRYSMREVMRVLRPGGNVLINVPFIHRLHQAPHDYNRYTEFMLRLLAEEAGLSVVKLEALGGGYAVLIDLISRLWRDHEIVVMVIQSVMPKLLSSKLGARKDIPLAYAMVCVKDGLKRSTQ